MKICPSCQREFSSRENFCTTDGTPLVTRSRRRPDAMIGRVLGERYRVEAKIGDGGQCVVYRAHHVRLRRHVAVKILPENEPGKRVSAESIKRFRREAEAIASLDHPCIIRVIDFGHETGVGYYFVMELARGIPLDEHLQRHAPLDVHELEALIKQVGGALVAAHDRRIVHRDLKASNVMVLDRDDDDAQLRLLILDFGIAKILRRRRANNPQADARTTVIGTPICMAPEQIEGASIDHRVDVYALGVLLYQALTGDLPFLDEEVVAQLRSHIEMYPDPPSSREGCSWIPAELDGLVLSMLAKDADARPGSAREVIERFEAIRTPVHEAWARRYLLPREATRASASAAPSTSRPKPPVLIVEDEPAIGRLLTQLVAREGYRHVMLSTGKAALRWCEDETPLVVLLDVMMPGVDGLSVLRSLRTRYAELPVILCTNLDARMLESEARRYNARLLRKVDGLHLLPGMLAELEAR